VTIIASCYCNVCDNFKRIIIEEKMQRGFRKTLYCPEQHYTNVLNVLYFLNESHVLLGSTLLLKRDRILTVEVIPLEREKYAIKDEEESYIRCEIIGDIESIVSSWEKGIYQDDWNALRQRALHHFNENYGLGLIGGE